MQTTIFRWRLEDFTIDKRPKDSGEDGSDRSGVKDRIEEGNKILGSNYRRQVKLQGAREVPYGEKASVTQRPFKTGIISALVTSIMLYACPIWSEALSVGNNKEDTVLGISSKRD